LWQLRVNCLTYCGHVHAHHGLEDALLFPAVRRANPALASVVAKLEADHRDVSDLLGNIEAAARLLASADTAEARSRLAGTLAALANVLPGHLAYEEDAIGPTLLQMTDWWR
jgi:hemerythrin-like domain-containing protein